MNKEEAKELLLNGRSKEWNGYRKKHKEWVPDLSGLDLSSVNFIPKGSESFDLSRANLCGTIFPESNFLRRYYDDLDIEGCVILKDALIDSSSIFPSDFNPLNRGAIFVSVSESREISEANQQTVFISYAWANEKIVLAVDQWLRGKGIKTRIDKRDFFAGSRISDEILRVMQDCRAVVIFYSSESKDKPWAQFERELASDLQMEAKKEGRHPPRIIYFVLDGTTLPNVTERNRIAVQAKGKKFILACEELYYGILQIPRNAQEFSLNEWSDYVF